MTCLQRIEAMERGEKTYVSGIPCKRGHVSARNTRGGFCIACVKLGYVTNREKRAAQASAWKRANKDKVCAITQRYRERHPDRVAAYNDAWQKANPEKSAASKKKWKTINREHVRAVDREWERRNPELMAAKRQKRRARLAGAEGFHTKNDVLALMDLQGHKCAMCKCAISMRPKSDQKKSHVDHIVPLSLGGSNWPSNLQMLCYSCNSSKGPKHPIDWAQQRGLLL